MADKYRSVLPVPEQCDVCASFEIGFVDNAVVYGRPFGKWPFGYHCSGCGAYVGCHDGTKIPLGRMADSETRRMRAVAHQHFDPLWQSGAMTRTEAYCLVARHLGIASDDCHIAQLNIAQLNFLIEACKGLTVDRNNLEVLKRRRDKKDAKHAKRIEREKSQSRRHSKYGNRYASATRRTGRSDQDSGED